MEKQTAPERIIAFTEKHYPEHSRAEVAERLIDVATGNREGDPMERYVLSHVFPELRTPPAPRTTSSEFPDWSFEHPIPTGFEDESWHNDTCPRFTSEALRLDLWIDYEDEGDRELTGDRFGLYPLIRTPYPLPGGGEGIEWETDFEHPIVQTDVWAEVVATIDARRAER